MIKAASLFRRHSAQAPTAQIPPPRLRELLAERYLGGTGIEFGALHFPLAVPPGVVVKYADQHPVETLKKLFPDVADIRAPDVVTEFETMQGVETRSQDFVIANHVLEHVEDPLKALKSVGRVLRPGGIAYLALPDKRFTFDREREITLLDHLLRDHDEGPDGSLLGHYEEWCRCVDHLEGDAFKQKVEAMLRTRSNIHFHVWDYPAMSELFSHVGAAPEFGLDIEASVLNGVEVIWILRKPPHTTRTLTWADLGEDVDDRHLPPLDRAEVDLTAMTPEQQSWREHGHLILPRFIPDELIDAYCKVRERLDDPQGWPDVSPYLQVSEIRDICLYRPLVDKLDQLLGEPMALHLNLTGWVSTERDWHQDDYLNPPTVNSHYAAAWIALDDIQPDAGPFEFIPGSHRWPFIRQARVRSLLTRLEDGDSNWPWHSERLLTPFFETEIERRGLSPTRFLARRGDVLIWHSRLLHRGARPLRPGAERRALIAHYSAAGRRPDMAGVRRHAAGGLYFLLDQPEADQDFPLDRHEPDQATPPRNSRGLKQRVIEWLSGEGRRQ